MPDASTSTPEKTSAEPPLAKRHWGKYRGTVVNNIDPELKGRLLVTVPGVVITNWAMPCVPLTDVMMGTFMRPRIGANIWVEFERGDPDKPIWVGCYWGDGELPLLAESTNAIPETTVMTLETATSGISISDVPLPAAAPPGTVIIRAGELVATISMSEVGVTITAPTVNIVAETAFTVTAPNFTVI